MRETSSRPYRVLIVDDDVSRREVLAEVLQSPQRSIELRDSSQAALEFLQHNPVDLAFVNLGGSGMSAGELADRIVQCYPHAQVMVCTGGAPPTGREQIPPAQADHLRQPLSHFGERLHLADSYVSE